MTSKLKILNIYPIKNLKKYILYLKYSHMLMMMLHVRTYIHMFIDGRLKSQKSTYVQKPKVAFKELRNIACDRKEWSSLSKAVYEVNSRIKKQKNRKGYYYYFNPFFLFLVLSEFCFLQARVMYSAWSYYLFDHETVVRTNA